IGSLELPRPDAPGNLLARDVAGQRGQDRRVLVALHLDQAAMLSAHERPQVGTEGPPHFAMTRAIRRADGAVLLGHARFQVVAKRREARQAEERAVPLERVHLTPQLTPAALGADDPRNDLTTLGEEPLKALLVLRDVLEDPQKVALLRLEPLAF